MAPDFFIYIFILFKFLTAVLLFFFVNIVKLYLLKTGFPIINYFFFTILYILSFFKQVSTLLNKIIKRFNYFKNFTFAETLNASTWFKKYNYFNNNTVIKILYDELFVININFAERVNLIFGLKLIYINYISIVKKAYIFFEIYLFRLKRVLFRGPRFNKLFSLIRSGNIFFYEYYIFGIKY